MCDPLTSILLLTLTIPQLSFSYSSTATASEPRVEAAKVAKAAAVKTTTTVSEAVQLRRRLVLVEHQLERQNEAEKMNERDCQAKEAFFTDLQGMDPENVARFGDGVQNTTLLRVLNGDGGMDSAMSITEEGQTRVRIQNTKQCLMNEMCVLNQSLMLHDQGEHGTCLFLIINLCFCVPLTWGPCLSCRGRRSSSQSGCSRSSSSSSCCWSSSSTSSTSPASCTFPSQEGSCS